MSWTPTYSGEPYSFAATLDGVVPFTPHATNFGELEKATERPGAVTLTFQSVLEEVTEACFTESLQRVWINGARLKANSVTFPAGWTVIELEAMAGWPGTCLEAVSPASFTGLSVEVDFGNAAVRRVVALTEWRGNPTTPVILVDPEGGGGDPGGN